MSGGNYNKGTNRSSSAPGHFKLKSLKTIKVKSMLQKKKSR